jgi:hypothetical protein
LRTASTARTTSRPSWVWAPHHFPHSCPDTLRVWLFTVSPLMNCNIKSAAGDGACQPLAACQHCKEGQILRADAEGALARMLDLSSSYAQPRFSLSSTLMLPVQ